MLGVLLTRWTIRLALAGYVAYLAGWLTMRHPRWPVWARWLWTASCALFIVHVGCAFAFYHGWSHAAAWRSTAEKTQQLLGVAVGDGIYGSYLFLALWIFDVLWLWVMAISARGSPEVAHPRSATSVPCLGWLRGETPWWRVGVHVYLLFIALNGAIVFESGPTRWVGIVALATLGILAGRRAYNRSASGGGPHEQLLLRKISKNPRSKEPKQMVH